jgi:hypothetical protein
MNPHNTRRTCFRVLRKRSTEPGRSGALPRARKNFAGCLTHRNDVTGDDKERSP